MPAVRIRWAILAGLVAVLPGLAWRLAGDSWTTVPPEQVLTVTEGPFRVALHESGLTAARESAVYRLPIGGRDLEITTLAPEGLDVQEGDLVVQFDATPLERELATAEQLLRQAEVEADASEAQLEEAAAVVDQASGPQATLELEEAESAADLARRKAERLAREVEALAPMLPSGYVTRDELERLQIELEAAQAAARLASRRASALRDDVQPRARRQAMLRRARQAAATDSAKARRQSAGEQVRDLRHAIEALSLFARAPGLVVYEEFVGAAPRRKVRVGDRVTATQPILTIPDLRRMVVQTSVAELDVHLVRAGQRVSLRFDAFPEAEAVGHVRSVGAMARLGSDRAPGERRFDVLVDLEPSSLGLRPDMTARVTIEVASIARAVLVPVAALTATDASAAVRVVDQGSVTQRAVRIGLADHAWAQVLDGLRPGERVLVDAGTAP
jgi:multidrug efflux pump subunit AcrA (membrane-fusion protein)